MMPISVADQTATLIADTRDGKKEFDFEKKKDALVTDTPLPAGDGYNGVVQIRQVADAKPQNFRFKLETYTCESCKLAEYACTCHD